MSQEASNDGRTKCTWGYVEAIKNVALVMAILMLIGMVFTMATQGINAFVGSFFAAVFIFLPLLVALAPTTLMVTFVRNILACGKM